MSRLRTIKQCYQHLKEQDKDSAVTLYFIRSLCANGKVDYITAGNKILVNLDSLIKALENVNS